MNLKFAQGKAEMNFRTVHKELACWKYGYLNKVREQGQLIFFKEKEQAAFKWSFRKEKKIYF